MNKWNHVVSQVDNWTWLLLAVGVLVVAKVYDIPALNAIAGACLVKIKEGNGKADETNNPVPVDSEPLVGVHPEAIRPSDAGRQQ